MPIEYLVEATGTLSSINSVSYKKKRRIITGITLSEADAIFEERIDKAKRKNVRKLNIEVRGPVEESLIGKNLKYMARYRSGMPAELIVQTLQNLENQRVYFYY